jgi:aconitate hydratase
MDPMEPRPQSESAALAAQVYERLPERVAAARRATGRPLTLTEKVLASHRREKGRGLPAARSDVDFDPDRVALQDALAQIVLLQFMTAGLDEVVVPTTVHCDHLIQARVAAGADLAHALDEHAEVYEFLRTAAARYGLGFWEPGAGIIHQVVFETYAFPGGMMIGTDSHTPTAGGLGMLAIGVGGGDAIDAMTGSAFNVRWPELVGVHLTGALAGWSSPKDVILEVARQLTASGGTGAVIEYFGPGVRSISATGRGTICNMGAETGATTSVFPFDERAAAYLEATGRGAIAAWAGEVSDDLVADPEVVDDPHRFFHRIIEIDLSALEPRINGPDAPDRAHRVADVGAWAHQHDVPVEISAALIGSCTNSSYEDLARAASVARQAAARGLRARVPLYVTPGSERIRATVERDGVIADLERIGATVLANACGPCIGQWDRRGIDPATPNTIVTSFNRNFPRRNDGHASTKAFVASPEIVVAYAIAGSLDFDPTSDGLPRDGFASDSTPGNLLAPPEGDDLPARGFAASVGAYVPPLPVSADGAGAEPVIAAGSDRLQRLEPFSPWHGRDHLDLPVVLKARGKCTTDQISPAGAWLRYRGHLDHMSGNLFSGVVNAFTGAVGEGRDPIDGLIRPFPEIAQRLGDAARAWCVVGDENYGEGSSREHAAMEPRYRGCVAVLARSFARIHETNLKKQGVLALTFADPATYDLVGEADTISVLDLPALAPGRAVRCELTRPDGQTIPFECRHTLTQTQIEWFRAGSALNVVRRERRAMAS